MYDPSRPIAAVCDHPPSASLPPAYPNYRLPHAAALLGWSLTQARRNLRLGRERFWSRGPEGRNRGTQIVPGPILVRLIKEARGGNGRKRKRKTKAGA